MSELCGKSLLYGRELTLPIWPRAANGVLPQARLRFVRSARGAAGKWCAYKGRRAPLFVDSVAAFVNCRHERSLKKVFQGTDGEAHVKGAAKTGGEWMRRLSHLSS